MLTTSDILLHVFLNSIFLVHWEVWEH